MIWGRPPKFSSTLPKPAKVITPEMLAGDSESSQQKALFAWAALNVGTYPALKFMFAVPNGFFSDAAQKAKMKAEGLRSGVPDIFLPCAFYDRKEQYYAGCFIELKIEKYRNSRNGGCSEEQMDFIEFASDQGYYCRVCYNWIEAKDVLIAYLTGTL